MRAPLRLLLLLTALLLALLPTGGSALPVSALLIPNPQSLIPDQLVLRLYFRDHAERDRLAVEWGAEEAPTTGGYLTLIADDNTLASLRARGYRVEVDEPLTANRHHFLTHCSTDTSGAKETSSLALQNPKSQIAQSSVLSQAGTFYGGYLTPEGIEAFLDGAAARSPLLAEKVDIGDSWCKAHPGGCTVPAPHNGYDLWALHVTNRAIPGPKPVFWFDAGIHSREIAAPEVAMRFISLLLDGYDTDPDARWLVDHHDIWVVPLVNPDGYRLVSAAPDGFPYSQRKNADSDDGCTVFPPTTFLHLGTDLNRNFPFKWGCCEGSSDLACSQTYRGPAPGSEEETQAVMAMLRSLVPDQRGLRDTDPAPLTTGGIYQNLHSFANMNLYSWGWGQVATPNEADLRNIAARMSARGAGGNGYSYCPAPQCLYESDGTASDWVYGELGMASFTTELAGDTFFPTYSEAGQLWEQNRGTLLYMAKIARAPYLLTRGPEVALAGERHVTAVQGSPAQVAATLTFEWEDNQYVQSIGGAELYVDVPPWQGGVPLPMLPTDGAFDSPTEAAAGTVDTALLSPGKHLVFVRARGASGYEGHESWGPVSAAWLTVLPSQAALDAAGGTPATRASGTRAGR